MSLREQFLDALIDGKIGHGIVVSRREFVQFFRNETPSYTSAFLSNSEIETGQHSPTYKHFTMRTDEGVYRIHPSAILDRMRKRELLPSK
jgi:hypothetical protein